MTAPEMGRLLGLNRYQAWEVYRHAKDQLKLIRVAEKPRITRESFDNWYANQTLFHIVPEISLIEEENTVVSDVIPEHKEYVSIREAAECLGISREARIPPYTGRDAQRKKDRKSMVYPVCGPCQL